jgi:hypothetical protein
VKISLPTLVIATSLFAPLAMAAPITYDITTSNSYFGSISGTITGEGSTLETYNITATAGSDTYTFTDLTTAQLDAGAFTAAFPYYGYQDGSGNPITEFFIENDDPSSADFASLSFYATGDFDTGLQYVGDAPTFNSDGSPYTNGGQPGSVTGPAGIQDGVGNILVLDDLQFTRVDEASVPEPSSAAILLGTMGLMFAWNRGRALRRG